MTTPLASSDLPTDPQQRAERVACCFEGLLRGIEIGTGRLTTLPEDTKADFVNEFDLITQSLRRNVILIQKMDEPEKPGTDERRRVVARRQVIRAVEDIIAAEALPEQIDVLYAELLARLDTAEFEDDLAELSVEQVVADLCRDLGLGDSRGVRRTPADVAALNARAAAPVGGMPKAPFVPDFAEPGLMDGVWRKPADRFGRGWRGGRGPSVPQAGASGAQAAAPMSDEEFHRIVDNTPEEEAWDKEFSKWKDSG